MTLDRLILLLAAAAVGAGLAGWLARRGAPRAGALAGLLILGQAAMLELIDAGPRVGYQHLRSVSQLMRETPIPLALVTIQAGIVLALAWPYRSRVLPGLRSVGSPVRLGMVALVVAIGGATAARNPASFAEELVLAGLMTLVALTTLVLALAACPDELVADAERWLARRLGPRTGDAAVAAPRLGRFEIGLALGVAILAALLNLTAYQHFPHVPDELAYLFQARYFAHGMLAVPPPPVQAAFDVDLLSYEATRWFSPVPPGWPAVLALGARLGAPWLVNPVLAGINVLLASLLLQRLYDRRTARLGLILLAASPWHLFLAMSYMTHTFAFTCALIGAVAVARAARDGGAGWVFVGGLATGVASLIRPLEGAILAVLLGLWILVRGRSWRRLIPGAVFALGTAATGALVLPYNRAMTGHPLTFPLLQYTDLHYGPGTNAMGFGPNRGLGWNGLDPLPGHGVLDVLVNADLNGTGVNVELLGWAVGALLPLALALFVVRRRLADRLMWTVVATVIGVHSLYWFSGGPDFGARYWFLILLPCLALVASVVTTLDRAVAIGGRAILGALLLTLSALVTFVPWRAIDKYYHYRGMRPDLRSLARARGFGTSLVLVRGDRHPDYHGASVLNPLDLRAAQPIYAWDRDSTTRQAVLAAYPDRPVWYVDGPTVTGDGYRVVAGPLPNPVAAAEPGAAPVTVGTSGGSNARPEGSSTASDRANPPSPTRP